MDVIFHNLEFGGFIPSGCMQETIRCWVGEIVGNAKVLLCSAILTGLFIPFLA
jgi:hypothetical protein